MGIVSNFLVLLTISEYVICHITLQRSHLTHGQEFEILTNLHKDVCSGTAICVPYVQCPSHVRETFKISCKTIVGRKGICCSTGQNHTGPIEEKHRGHGLVTLDPVSLGIVARHSRVELAEIRAREVRLLSQSDATILCPGSASYGHFRNSRLFNNAELSDVMNVASRALEIAIATRAFKDRQGVTNNQLELGLIQQDLTTTPLGGVCSPRPRCSFGGERFRKIDGTCNNLRRPSWGASKTPYARLLPPSYQDGVWSERVAERSGQPLPSPRHISATIISNMNAPDYDHTLMVMQFGQYLSHDITQSIDASYGNGSAISCCSQDGSGELHPHFRHYACMPITVPRTDPFYGRFGQGCMNFVRSILAPNHDCTLGYSQQMNKITHFIDSSSVYGSSPEQTGELRSFHGGKLKTFNDYGRHLLPISKDTDACLTMEQGSACFTSGDTRTNQMVSLVVLHTIFLREHNRLAEKLFMLNPHWEDERLFLEARRLLIAITQVIVYKEFLPVVIGDIAMEEFQLSLGREADYSRDYNENIQPSITNEFATAALRFGHSTVEGLLKVYGTRSMEEMIAIPEVMFQPARMRKQQFMDQMLNTLTTEPMQKVDCSLAEALTKYMFRAGNPFGIDLASLNIQRGRDHGLRPYNDYRELSGLPRIRSFEEFGPQMGAKLKSVYASVDDIDLWVGGLLEEKAPGSILGYTFRDIIADQFFRLKKGDRYFFEHHPRINPGHFSPDQLVELRKASMSRLVCDNSDHILLARQAPNAFRKPGVPGNEFVDCFGPEIPEINLIYWQE